MQTEGQRDGREDARIARDRALEAMVSATDFETQRSLWRAALKFHERVKAAGSAFEDAPRLVTTQADGARLGR